VDRLWRSWREACEDEGRVVLLTGEPGIGKSRLTEELIERLESERYTLLRCFCSPYHSSSALFPLINQLERAAGFERADLPQRKLEKLEAVLARSAAETEHRVAVLADLLSLSTGEHYSLPVESPRERRERVFVVLLEQLAGLAKRRPVLMILEDLHWIDPTSQELLARLVELVPQSRVLVLLTARPEYSPAWRDGPHIRTIPLWGLDRSDAAQVIAGVAGGRALPAEVVEPILGRTEGVPLFLEELTKTMLESGLLHADAERYVLAGPLPPLAIPTSLEASLLARLDRLAPGMEVAQAGAALGRQFSYALIRSVSSQPDAALHGALAQLVDAQIIQQRGLPPDAEYRFNHAMVRDVAYGMMMRGTRQRLHGQIVQALETDFPDDAEMEPEVVAMHCSGADLIDKAVGYWLKAGSRAVTRSANREAIDHLTKGIALLPRIADSPERARTELTMQLTLGHASIAVNGYCNEVTARAYARAGELIEFGDLDQRVGILFGVYFGHLMGGKLERGIEPLQTLFALAQKNGHTGYICLAHRVLGVLALYRGELLAARTHLETAVELYDHEQHAALTFRFGSHVGISAQAWLSVALWLLGLPDTARRLADDAVAASRRFGHAHTLGHVMGLVTLVYAESEDFATLAAIGAEGEEFCDRHRLGFFGPWLRFMHLWAGAHDGNRGESIAEMKDALARYEETNTTLMRAYFRGLLVRSLLTAGRLDEAAGEVEVALRDIAETGEYWWRPEIHRLRAECLLALPNADKDAAESCLRHAIADARARGSKMLELRVATGLARLLRAENREHEAETLLAPILGGFTEGFATPDLVGAQDLIAARPAAE
jgi:predicted ATPase